MSLVAADAGVTATATATRRGSWRDELLPDNSNSSGSNSNSNNDFPSSSSSCSVPQRAAIIDDNGDIRGGRGGGGNGGGGDNCASSSSSSSSSSSDGYESDWEREVSDLGDVFYVVPFTNREMLQQQQQQQRQQQQDGAQHEDGKVGKECALMALTINYVCRRN